MAVFGEKSDEISHMVLKIDPSKSIEMDYIKNLTEIKHRPLNISPNPFYIRDFRTKKIFDSKMTAKIRPVNP